MIVFSETPPPLENISFISMDLLKLELVSADNIQFVTLCNDTDGVAYLYVVGVLAIAKSMKGVHINIKKVEGWSDPEYRNALVGGIQSCGVLVKTPDGRRNQNEIRLYHSTISKGDMDAFSKLTCTDKVLPLENYGS